MAETSHPSHSPGKKFVIFSLLTGVALVFVSVALVSFFAVRSLRSENPGGVLNFSAGKLFASTNEEPEFFPDEGDIAVVDLRGVIFRSRPLIRRLNELAEREDIKAIILRIDSPGGAVGPSQEIHDTVLQLRKKHSKQVICSLGDIAASGGYYVAAACDKIVANPGTLTGSIGVIMQLVNLQGLYSWAKIEPQVLKAGKFKDMGSETRPLKDEEKKLFQDLLDNVHQQFRNSVKEDRNLSQEQIEKYADGRIFTGEQGKLYGFVDELGGESRAIEIAAEIIGVEKPKVIRESLPRSPWGPLFGGGSPLPWDSDESGDSAEEKLGSLKDSLSTGVASLIGSHLPAGASFHLKPGVPYFLPSFFASEGVWKR